MHQWQRFLLNESPQPASPWGLIGLLRWVLVCRRVSGARWKSVVSIPRSVIRVLLLCRAAVPLIPVWVWWLDRIAWWWWPAWLRPRISDFRLGAGLSPAERFWLLERGVWDRLVFEVPWKKKRVSIWGFEKLGWKSLTDEPEGVNWIWSCHEPSILAKTSSSGTSFTRVILSLSGSYL